MQFALDYRILSLFEDEDEYEGEAASYEMDFNANTHGLGSRQQKQELSLSGTNLPHVGPFTGFMILPGSCGA